MYEYKGVTIEYPAWGPPSPLNKAGDPYVRWPKRVAQAMDEFLMLPAKVQHRYRIGGGCSRID
jgi:hypothetical protein